MNDYKVADIQLGQKEHFFYSVTESKMELFKSLTGDENPLHCDERFALDHGFSGRVAYGMLTASLISTLGGCYIPGKFCLIQGVEVKFLKPVFIGDTLEVIGEVTKIDRDLRYIEIKVTIMNQKNTKVLRGLLKAGILDER